MSAPADHVHEGRDQTAPGSPDVRGPDGPLDASRETEASCEAIER
jgi:hypothetical protein